MSASKASNYARAVRTAVMLSMSLTEAPGPEAGYTHDDYDEAMAGIDWFVSEVAKLNVMVTVSEEHTQHWEREALALRAALEAVAEQGYGGFSDKAAYASFVRDVARNALDAAARAALAGSDEPPKSECSTKNLKTDDEISGAPEKTAMCPSDGGSICPEDFPACVCRDHGLLGFTQATPSPSDSDSDSDAAVRTDG